MWKYPVRRGHVDTLDQNLNPVVQNQGLATNRLAVP